MAIPLAGAPNIKVFQKGKHSRADILTEFRKYKRSFDADEWAGGFDRHFHQRRLTDLHPRHAGAGQRV